MPSPAHRPSTATADPVHLADTATYRAVCLTCGAVQDAGRRRVLAQRWGERHRTEETHVADVVIEATLLLPSGTVGRFFEAV